jgi:hypothetical protein
MSKYKLYTLFSFILIINTAQAQLETLFDKLYLIKTNGEIIRYKAANEEPDHIRFKLKNNEWIKINIDSILAYYTGDDPIQYLIPYKSLKKGSKLIVDPLNYTAKDSTHYEFAERILEGKIEVYQQTIESYGTMANGAGGTMPTNSTTYNVYAQLDNEYIQLHPVRKKDEEDIVNKLNKAISDDKYILEKAQSKTFKYNRDNVLELLEAYNVNAHQPVSFNPDKNPANTLLFRMNNQQTKSPLVLELGEITYSLLPKDLIRVYLPTNQPVKICFGDSGNRLCKLIIGSEKLDKSIELSQQKNGILRLTTEQLTPYDIIDIEKTQKKRAKKALKDQSN